MYNISVISDHFLSKTVTFLTDKKHVRFQLMCLQQHEVWWTNAAGCGVLCPPAGAEAGP